MQYQIKFKLAYNRFLKMDKVEHFLMFYAMCDGRILLTKITCVWNINRVVFFFFFFFFYVDNYRHPVDAYQSESGQASFLPSKVKKSVCQ
jgi:hypothetical protein